MYKNLCLIVIVICLSGCKVKYTSVGSISNACELVKGLDLLEKVCDKNNTCVEYNVECKALSYSSKLSSHTKADWKKDSAKHFDKPSRTAHINANFDAYKKWGMGERRFFTISDNFDDASKSSKTFYFRLNSHNMPRLVGMTFYDAKTQKVTEHAFTYLEDMDSAVYFKAWDNYRTSIK